MSHITPPGGGVSVPTTVVHGSTASTARPASSIPITWIGTVAPTNATSNDLWVDESTVAGAGSAALPMLAAWVLTEAWRVVSGTRDGTGALTAASVSWPDGGTGSYTADTVSTAFPGLVDAYHITYVPPGGGTTQTFTQAAVTRGLAGGITAQPVLAVS